MELAKNLSLLNILLSSLCVLSAIDRPTASQREKVNGKARYNEESKYACMCAPSLCIGYLSMPVVNTSYA